MNKKIFLRAIAFWFILLVLAILNGVIRNSVYQKSVGELKAHQISTFILIIIIFLVARLFVGRQKDLSNFNLIGVGLIWLVFTEFFEFFGGHYIFGNTWEKILADYNLCQGRLWFLVIIALWLAPYVAGRFLKSKF